MLQQTENWILQEFADFVQHDSLNTGLITVAGFDDQTRSLICAGRKSGHAYLIHNEDDYLRAIRLEGN